MTREGEPPLAVVIGSGTPVPLRVARRIYPLAPLSHMLFVVDREQLAEFRGQMALAPMIGTYWSIVESRSEALLSALESAARASRQRRHLRTSLTQINLRLSEERPTVDSAEYRKLVISDKYLATILEHAQDAIISLDLQSRIASWNRGAVGLFGFSSEEAANLRLDDLASGKPRRSMRRWFDLAKAGTPVVQEEAECRRGANETFTADLTFVPVRSDAGEVIAVSLTARDVTERRRNEEELRRIRAELEDRVAERTAALRAVNRELEAFTYSASHDLRAPLRGIDGFTQALLEDYGDSFDDTASRYLERIRAGARRMGDTIDSLLMLSRISQAELHTAPVNLAALAREIVTGLRELEPGREVELRVEPGLSLQADPQLMRIALENLLNNAWKFTRERDQALIEVGRVENRSEKTFFVRDNGAGFDMTYADKLFLPFQRLHHPLRFEGSGIGLGTVQRVIARHGGRVWATSEAGEGATFYFTVPEGIAKRQLSEVDRPA
ncbi:MAG: ATP-binding protein [Trueperaceae bacterium]